MYFVCSKLLQFLHETFGSLKELCPKFFRLIYTSFTRELLQWVTDVWLSDAPFALTPLGTNQKKKL